MTVRSRKDDPSQVMELFLAIAGELGFTSDEQLAMLAQAGPESVGNWRSGAVREFKARKLEAVIAGLRHELQALRARAGATAAGGAALEDDAGLLHIERGASPADLQRDFRDRVAYDYAGHRFLYYEPQGALAWEGLIKAGYDQDAWLAGTEVAARAWLDTTAGGQGQPRGPLAQALGLTRTGGARGLDLVSLGAGEAGKEVRVLGALFDAEKRKERLPWMAAVPVDVSIPLLMGGARALRHALASGPRPAHDAILPICADFEDGPLAFTRRLRTSVPASSEGVRLVLVLGNVFGNLRDEEQFVRKQLSQLARPGDLVWIEVGMRQKRVEEDPLFQMTLPSKHETPGEASRRLLLEGPYRRWAAALGRPAPDIELRIWLREADESARVPGSVNFSHDLVIKDERRSCTMLYSRRYQVDPLVGWFERLGYDAQALREVKDGKGTPRVVHLLLRRRAAAT